MAKCKQSLTTGVSASANAAARFGKKATIGVAASANGAARFGMRATIGMAASASVALRFEMRLTIGMVANVSVAKRGETLSMTGTAAYAKNVAANVMRNIIGNWYKENVLKSVAHAIGSALLSATGMAIKTACQMIEISWKKFPLPICLQLALWYGCILPVYPTS